MADNICASRHFADTLLCMDDPLYRRVRAHAKSRLVVDADAPRSEVLASFAKFLELETEMVERYHRKGDSGLRVAKAKSITIDVLLESLWEHAKNILQRDHPDRAGQPSALVALGGYGREELCPFSDIDIMFLFPDGGKADHLATVQKVLTDTILYLLWDLKLKVGHATRTIKQAITEAKEEVQSKNAMIESRVVAGSKPLFNQFFQAFKSFCLRDDIHKYIDQRLEDQESRRAKYGGTVFMQEPDVKNGVGALRDFQNIIWMAQIKLGTGDLNEIERLGYVRNNEHRSLIAGYDFLLRVRHELHFQIKRPTDILTLDKQPSVAQALGYSERDIFKRVEVFMRDYYTHARNIFDFSKVAERRLSIDRNRQISFRAVIESRRQVRKGFIDGFEIIGKTLVHKRKDIFEKDPARLIRVFRHLQQTGANLDFDLQQLIRESLSLVSGVVRDSGANAAFRSILQSPGEVHRVLSAMHDLGVLDRFIPEFAGLTCLVQHEYYHRYTADIHTLNTIKHLDDVFLSPEGENRRYNREIRETAYPSLLYLTLLLHDIGKGRGIKGHDKVGAEMAKPILERLGVPGALHERILFIIANHLEMARFWQKFDVDDPKTAQSFADLVQDEDHLRYLYVHTFCDAKGTAADLWNSFKDMLHTSLFKHTVAYLGGEERISARRERRLAMISRESIQQTYPHLSGDEIEAHFNLLPERYFINHDSEAVGRHLNMIHQLLARINEAESLNSLVPVVEWRDDPNIGMSEVNIVTWDRAGLFFKLAGALSVAGLNIMSSKAISRDDHITIDTFYVCEPGGGPVQNEQKRQIFREHLEDALLKNRDLMPAIREQARKSSKPSYLRVVDQLQAPIAPSVEVYHELSLKRTIIEVQANDQIGLLYRLSRAIYDFGFDITFARIATERNVALDTFYIERIAQEHESDERVDILELRTSIQEIIENGQASTKAATA